MTEQQWLTTDQVTWLLSSAETVCSARKLAMFQLECARPLAEAEGDSELSALYRQVEFTLTEDLPVEMMEEVTAAARRYATSLNELLFQAVAEAPGKTGRRFVRECSQAAVAAFLMHDALSPEGWWRVTTDIDEGPELDRYFAFEGFREA